MATVNVDGDTLRVELSGWDKVWAVHGSFRIPLANVAGASVDKPPSFWESLKLIGTNSPWPFKMAGTFLYHGETVFFDYQREDSVLVIDLQPGASTYKHLFVHIDPPDTPADAAARINAALSAASGSGAGSNVNPA
ncbi:MAG: hypothetical protein JO036_14420 [Candidatus Eremiobacteraeota bacterium]|nr:hypothetical protein [Candidatus Eremiobacteraeota bacterium]